MQTTKIFFERYEKWLLPAIFFVTLAVFSPALWCDFINFDDPGIVTENPFVTAGLTMDGIRWAFTSGHMANWMPLSWMSHMLDVQMFGLNPAGHHAGNILFHAANSALLFIVLRRATGGVWQSAVVALLFALHPLRVESVAWIAERKDVLSALFWLLTMYAYCRYAEKRTVISYGVLLVLFALGLMAKPMLVTLPLVLLLFDWWPLKRLSVDSGGGSALFRRGLLLIAEKIPLMLLSAVSSFITFKVQSVNGELYQGYTVLSRLGKALISYCTYLKMMVWPTKLAIIYPFSKYPPSQLSISIALLILLIITAVVVWLGKKYPFFVTGWGWYVITLLPVIGLIQIGQHSVADRYTYIPMVGILMMVAWGVPHVFKKLRIQRIVLPIGTVIVLGVLIVVTLIQLSYWKNSVAQFSHTIAVTEGNWVAHNNLGRVLLLEGKTEEAIPHFLESIAAKPSYALAHLNLGNAYQVQKKYSLAIEKYLWVLTLEPWNEEARLDLALLYMETGERELAMKRYQELQAMDSRYASDLWKELQARFGVK